ncbi:MAG: 3'-5' exonuclease domain-containing protein 2 [Bacteroidales bacterium]|nr:3'-5' exonuclease domain-containing protein 2 [Bacteroidales bacterium]
MENTRFTTTITKEEINELPKKQFKGNIHLIENYTELRKAIKIINSHTILGFDTETKPTFKKKKRNKVALLQLSTKNDAFLFRLNKIGLPEEIVSILTNEKITKVGTALKEDLKTLKELNDFNPAGFIDLQDYSNQYGIKANALKSLTAIVLGFKISKSQQTSNWENDELTEAQLKYAATDAWVCYKIYNELNHF